MTLSIGTEYTNTLHSCTKRIMAIQDVVDGILTADSLQGIYENFENSGQWCHWRMCDFPNMNCKLIFCLYLNTSNHSMQTKICSLKYKLWNHISDVMILQRNKLMSVISFAGKNKYSLFSCHNFPPRSVDACGPSVPTDQVPCWHYGA